ncbi:hypothetical protein AUEXF2481DRAFT_273056 [Aureobasidium subglaciale EXF-2481]|uniref:Uncharacterized protein n=1 Tax=Aureobasidium subglaciale (strain EXF-2481) TaxID=1043005 RepID=A0A074Y9G2_AURSE|nr:uncharacterized protein AUEXF2481DRAFT_273056 [Aureobasidium subglaciale EXF-2481]KEQ94405.1 hypothetical protein AUEXF2481DRAFT_273056 [Aureobasidium subglaciale EXF-2481]
MDSMREALILLGHCCVLLYPIKSSDTIDVRMCKTTIHSILLCVRGIKVTYPKPPLSLPLPPNVRSTSQKATAPLCTNKPDRKTRESGWGILSIHASDEGNRQGDCHLGRTRLYPYGNLHMHR